MLSMHTADLKQSKHFARVFKMATLPLVGTIESDDEIEGLGQDIESEEEEEKVYSILICICQLTPS